MKGYEQALVDISLKDKRSQKIKKDNELGERNPRGMVTACIGSVYDVQESTTGSSEDYSAHPISYSKVSR
jgi:hypothetical protein